MADARVVAYADADYVLRWLRQSSAPPNIIGLQERAVAALASEASAAEGRSPKALKDSEAAGVGEARPAEPPTEDSVSAADAARLKHALSACIPWVAASRRGKAQEALAQACLLLGIDPFDWTCAPDVLRSRMELLADEVRYPDSVGAPAEEQPDARAAAIAACPQPYWHETHRYCPVCPWTEKDDDPDYSPAYQDEYQRLWHEARAELGRLREQLDAARQALDLAERDNEKHPDGPFLSEQFWAARAALGDVAAPPNQTTDEVSALGQKASESRADADKEALRQVADITCGWTRPLTDAEKLAAVDKVVQDALGGEQT